MCDRWLNAAGKNSRWSRFVGGKETKEKNNEKMKVLSWVCCCFFFCPYFAVDFIAYSFWYACQFETLTFRACQKTQTEADTQNFQATQKKEIMVSNECRCRVRLHCWYQIDRWYLQASADTECYCHLWIDLSNFHSISVQHHSASVKTTEPRASV